MMGDAVLQCPSLTNSSRCWHTARRRSAVTMAQLVGMAIKGRKKFKMWGLAKC